MYSVITLVVAAAIVGGGYFLLLHVGRERFTRYLKTLAIAFSAIGLFRYILSDSFAVTVFDGADIAESLRRWFYYIGYAVVPMSVFFDNKVFRNVATCFSLPVSVVSAIMFEHTFAYFLSPDGGALHLTPPIRYVIYIVELALAIAVPVLMQISTRHGFEVRNGKGWIYTLAALPLMLVAMMPAYIPQSLIGYTSLPDDPYSYFHIGWMFLMIVVTVLICYFFKHRPEDDRWKLCIFLAIAQLYNTNSAFLMGFRLTRIPLQLCSIAAFFYLYAMITRSRRVFGFAFLANFIGGLVGLFAAPLSTGALCFWNVHYIHEHTFVLIIPIIATVLGVFPRLDSESLKYTAIIFTVYFVTVFVIGFLLNGYTDRIGYVVNYFYMFSIEEAVKYVSFAEVLGVWKLSFGRFSFYPLLVVFIYTFYLSMCTLYYFIMRLAYKIKDGELCALRPKYRTF